MSLETEHRRHYTEPEPLPDEPQPIHLDHRAGWTHKRGMFDRHPTNAAPTGRHRKPWGRRAAPWTLERAETDAQARNPRRNAA